MTAMPGPSWHGSRQRLEEDASREPRWHPFKRLIEDDQSDTRLTFNDVVFGIVITQIFLEAVPMERLTWSLRTHLLLAFAITMGSYIGYRKSLKRTKAKLAFFNLPLVQFALDLCMIYLYYHLTITPDVTASILPTLKPVDDAQTVFLIFMLYLAWDGVSVLMRMRGYNVTFSRRKATVTVVCCIVSLAIFLVALSGVQTTTEGWLIAVDLCLVGLGVAYRWAKDALWALPQQPEVAQCTKDHTESTDAVRQNSTPAQIAVPVPEPTPPTGAASPQGATASSPPDAIPGPDPCQPQSA